VITPVDGRPPYRQIADDLRKRIRDGAFTPAGKLPSEAYLAHEYGVGRGAVRHALTYLEQQGVIVRTKGATAQVRDTAGMTVVDLPEGCDVAARPATEAELVEFGLPVGAWMLVAVERRTEVEWDAWPAGRVRLRPGR
jgi:DNA-binding FadR family transcriptional regulator